MLTDQEISDRLIEWYALHARILPWRNTKDPYLIWLSEIILQQTSVVQGIPYYERFVNRFPDIHSLANAEEDEVLKLWQGLGYYSRARNLHYSAQHIVEKLKGKFPNCYNKLIKLKGVGPYTAAAIASFAYNENVVVVDGNVKRFISRLFGIYDAIDLPATEKKIRSISQALINKQEPFIFNQALMEFGALQCMPKSPICIKCPFSKICIAFNEQMIPLTAQKSKTIIKKERFFYFALFIDKNNETFIQKRSAKDIWMGLYQLPLIERSQNISDFPMPSAFGVNNDQLVSKHLRSYKHLLTHQIIFAQFVCYETKTKALSSENPGLFKIPLNHIEHYALPRLIDLYLSDLSITLL